MSLRISTKWKGINIVWAKENNPRHKEVNHLTKFTYSLNDDTGMFPRAGEARVQEPRILLLHLFKVKSVRIPESTVTLFFFHDAHVAISLPFGRKFSNDFPWPSCPWVPFLDGIWLSVLCSYLRNIPLIVLCS